MVDPGVVVKLGSSRIEGLRGNSHLIAEGTAENPVIFTSFWTTVTVLAAHLTPPVTAQTSMATGSMITPASTTRPMESGCRNRLLQATGAA